MAAFDSAIAVDQSVLTFGEQATIIANATSNATADASSVDGIAEASANITDNTGLDRSTLTAGTGATVKVDVNGTAQSSASTINALNTAIVLSPGTGTTFRTVTAAVTAGDMFMGNDGTEYFVLTSAAAGADFTVSLTPGGTAVTYASTSSNFTSGATELEASIAASMFSGDLAGITDTTSSDVDLTIGTAGVVDVDLNALAQATSSNVDGDANAISNTGSSGALGITGTGISAGTTATITADVDADALSVATSVGSPTATTVGSGADANADSDLTAVGINDFGASATDGNITVGTDATIRGAAGSSVDRVTVSATATTQTGAATADADAAKVAGILDAQDGTATSVNKITIGDAGTVVGTAYTNFDAVAASTTGAATADSTATNISGIQSDTVVIGTDGKVQGQANTQMDVSATVVDGITSGTGIASATATISETKGVDLEVLTVGDSATGTTGYNILGRTDADVNVSAASTGADSAADSATAIGTIGQAAGLELGNSTTTAGAGLTVGTNATVAGVADVQMDASAASVDGNVTANALVGAGQIDITADFAGTIGAYTSAVAVKAGDAISANNGTKYYVVADAAAGVAFDLSATQGGTALGAGGPATTLFTAAGGAYFVDPEAGSVGIELGDVASIGTNATVLAQGAVDLSATATSIGNQNVDITADFAGTTGAYTSAVAVKAGDAISANNGTKYYVVADAAAGVAFDLSATQGGTALGAGGPAITLFTAAGGAYFANAGVAEASAGAQFVSGLNISDATSDASFGTNATIVASGTATADATATSVTGSQVDAYAGNDESGVLMDVRGINSDADITFGTSANVNADATVGLTATASNVGTLGFNSLVSSDASLQSAVAIDMDGAFVAGTTATVEATTTVANKSTAQSVNGAADADIDVDLAVGLKATDDSVTIGTAGNIDVDATLANVASASSIDASSANVDATVNNDRVVGIELASTSATTGVLSTGTTMALDVDAVSSQIATASNIGDPTSPSPSTAGFDYAATANVASGDLVYGIQDTVINVGSNTTQLTSSATLVGDATASNMSGTSTAIAGGTSGEVIALDNSNTTIGLNATNGMSLQASSTLSADASSIEDAALAQAGTVTAFNSAVFSNQGRLVADDVTGVELSDITIGNDAGTIQAGAIGRLEAIASTNGTTTGAQAATAQAAQDAAGLFNSTVIIGNDGNLTGTANLAATASASNVGDVASTTNNANSVIQLNAQGIKQTDAAGDTTTIGADGSVAGRAYVDGSSISTSVNGSASAQGDLISLGLNLDDLSDITIGQSGNISGLSVMGEMSSTGSFTDQVDVLASTTSEDATAYGIFDSAGILGLDAGVTTGDQTVLTAGPTDGDVTGQALSGVNVVASTIGNLASDNAIADLSGSVSGIQDVDILGGMQGINTVKGTSFGDFDVSASSIKGDATAASNTDAYGIFDSSATPDGTITLSGNIVAQAVLSNTVVASSVNGNASATATGDAIGMGGYDITILGSGSFTASANSSSDADASSVKFGARA